MGILLIKKTEKYSTGKVIRSVTQCTFVCSVYFLAKLVIADKGQPITLRTKSILMQNNGELHIGSHSRPYSSPLQIILYGRSTDTNQHPIFGNKYIGVTATGTLEIHGPWKRSWTFLKTSLQRGCVIFNSVSTVLWQI